MVTLSYENMLIRWECLILDAADLETLERWPTTQHLILPVLVTLL